MNIAEALLSVPQAERGGEIAQRGFDYQACWALSQLLEYELDGKSYVFIFEYHDDVIILNKEENPSQLNQSSKKKPVSIIGKLYLHEKNFSTFYPNLWFVTNAAFSFRSKKVKSNTFAADTIGTLDQKKIIKAVSEQIDLDEGTINLKRLSFIQSSLSLEDHMTHLKGMLVNFLNKKYGSDTGLSASALATLLESECRQRSKYKSAEIINFKDLVDKKGFSNTSFNKLVEAINKEKSTQPTWENAEKIFQKLDKGSYELFSLETAFSLISSEIKSSENSASSVYLSHAIKLFDLKKLQDIHGYFKNIIDTVDELCPDHNLVLSTNKKDCLVAYSIVFELKREGEK